jgi:hypothetical protein
MAGIDFTIDSLDIDRLKDKLDFTISDAGLKQLARKMVVRATATMKASIVANTPSRSGALRSSIHGITTGLESRLYTDNKYASILEDGTEGHYIYPMSKQALYWQGAQYPVRSVYSPGIKATHFFTKGIEMALPAVEAEGMIFLNELNDMLKV